MAQTVDPFQVQINGLTVQFSSMPLFNTPLEDSSQSSSYNHWVIQVLFYRSKEVFRNRRESKSESDELGKEYYTEFADDRGPTTTFDSPQHATLSRFVRQESPSSNFDTMASVPKEAASIGNKNRGTIIAFVPFVEPTKEKTDQNRQTTNMAEVAVPIVPIISVLAIVSVVVALVIAILLARRQKNRSRAAHYKDKCFNGHTVPPPTMLYTPVQISESYPSSFPPVTSALKQNDPMRAATLPTKGRSHKGQVMFSPQVTTISGGEEYIDHNGVFRTIGGYMETSA